MKTRPRQPRGSSTLLIFALLLGLALFGISLAAFPPPPRDAVITMIDGKEYVKGEIYLTAHKDTLLLKRFGFRQFAFDGWALSRVRYAAMWPKSARLDSLPPEVSGIEYDVREAVTDTTDFLAPQDTSAAPEDTTEASPAPKPEGE